MTENSNNSFAPEPPCVTRLELAELLRVSVRTVDRMIAAREIPVRRVRGRAVRFLRSDVERYLNGEMQKAECGKCEPHGQSTSQTTDQGQQTLNHQPNHQN